MYAKKSDKNTIKSKRLQLQGKVREIKIKYFSRKNKER